VARPASALGTAVCSAAVGLGSASTATGFNQWGFWFLGSWIPLI
jgi:hypothetical protein